MIGNSVLMELIANGVLWYYQSYNHKAAVEEMKLKNEIPSGYNHKQMYVPDEYKRNHIIWRVGKLRTMTFDPEGMIKKMYVGRSSKYTKLFFPTEVGTPRIKPIVNISQDKYGLIKAGYAIDDNILKR